MNDSLYSYCFDIMYNHVWLQIQIQIIIINFLSRSQSVKYAKIMSPNLATEHLYSRSASYILTEDEVH